MSTHSTRGPPQNFTRSKLPHSCVTTSMTSHLVSRLNKDSVNKEAKEMKNMFVKSEAPQVILPVTET